MILPGVLGAAAAVAGGAVPFPAADMVGWWDASDLTGFTDGESLQNEDWVDKQNGYIVRNTDGFVTWNETPLGNSFPSVEQEARSIDSPSALTDFEGAGSFTCFAVLYVPATTGVGYKGFFGWNEDVSNNGMIRLLLNDDGTMRVQLGQNVDGVGRDEITLANGTAYQDDFHIFEWVVQSNGNIIVLIDGVEEGTGSISSPGIPASPSGGQELINLMKASANVVTDLSSGAEEDNAHVAEWAVWRADIGSANREATRQDLSTRYGITI